MPRPLPLLNPPIGPFDRGLNDVIDARLLAPNAAQTAQNVDLTTGALKPMYGPGTAESISGVVSPSFGSVDAAYTWIAVPSNTFWIGAQTRQHVALDTWDTAYTTDINTSEVAAVPRALYSPGAVSGYGSYPLGVTAPTTLSVANGAGGGLREYAYTFVTEDGLESNPFPDRNTTTVRSAANYQNAVLTVQTSSDARVVARRIYATDENDAGGEMYYIGEIANNTGTSFTDATLALDEDRRLNWSVDGYADAASIQDDHSPWLAALVLSNQLHGATPGADRLGAGILFGTDADGYTARWSQVGNPQYWPQVNYHRLPEKVEAIVSQGFQTLYFLASQIWSFSGDADFAIVRGKTDAERGVRAGCGHTVARCPWGVLFLADEGIALFDGGRAPVITEGLLDPRNLAALTIRGGVYFQDFYFLFHSTGTIILDLRGGLERVRVTTSDTVVIGWWVNNYDFPDNPVGTLYVMTTRGFVRKWSLIEAMSGATRQALTWKTPKLTWGDAARLKHLTEMRVAGSGAATFSLFRDDETTARWSKSVADLARTPWFRLGPGLKGRAWTLQVTTAAGADTTIRAIEPIGVVCDGA